MMRLRKKGTLPPVYPNGWFALLDSDQVMVNQVKYVTALGKLKCSVFGNIKLKTHLHTIYTMYNNINIFDKINFVIFL